MNIDRKMASCLLEIKRSLPNNIRPHFKLSSPNICEMVYGIYQTTQQKSVKRLAKLFLESAGEGWHKKVNPNRFEATWMKQSDIMVNKILDNIKKRSQSAAGHGQLQHI